MNETTPRPTCPECGLELPAGAGNAACPGCSLRLALSPEGAPPPVGSPPLPPGLKSRFFGDYEILEQIGRGGMGVVYRARQLRLNRLVALKMVQSHHLLSAEARLRFRVEIEAVAQLNHPHIVSLHESGEHDGAHFFTMRLVEGGDLAGDLKRARPLRERVQLLVKVCRAVHYAHQRGILHRDLKPSNILVDEQGEPHVADFGLAKSLDHDTGFTFTSSVLGSPNYMAPEQAAGKTRQLSTAVDVYGLGAILYHLLAGRPPFQANTPIETLRQVVDRDPAAPRHFNPHVDADLETIALKCLRKEAAARYGTAEDLAQDLERWLAGQPILARPLGFVGTAWRWSRRHPVQAVLALALGVALATIGVGTALAVMRIQRAEAKADGHLRESLLREAGSLRLGGDLGHRSEGLRLIREAAALGGPPEFRARARNELLATLARTELEFVPMTLSNLPPQPERLGLHPFFALVASVRNDTSVVFRALAGGTPQGRLDSRASVSRLDAFSPNGRYVALWHDDTLSVRDLRTGAACVTRTGTNTTLAFHPREDALLVQEVPNEAVWLDLPSGTERHRWTAPVPRLSGRTNGWHTLAFAPDGRTVAGASGTSLLIELLDPHTGTQLRVFTNTAHTVAMSWSRDGTLLAAATADWRVLLWEAATGVLRWSSPAMVAPARSLAFHPQRDWLAVACEDAQVRFIDVPAERFVYEHPADSRLIRFSPDGNRVGPVQSQGQWGWLELRRPEEFSAFNVGAPHFRLSDARFSTDGQLLAVGHSDMVVLCDPKRGARLLSKGHWRTSACGFDPRDNSLLATETNGLVRYRWNLAASGRLTFPTSEVIHPGMRWQAFDFSARGDHFAAYHPQSNFVAVFDHTLTHRRATVGPHAHTAAVALSPDGRWLTTASRADRSVKLWAVAQESLLRTFPAGLQPRSAFSADGRWLAVTGEDLFELRETGTWRLRAPFPASEGNHVYGAAAFTPDSRMLAMVVDRFTVHLVDLRDFTRLGILRAPVPFPIRGLAFAANGRRLAAVGAEANVAVWHLDELNRRLKEFGLGWEEPDSVAAEP